MSAYGLYSAAGPPESTSLRQGDAAAVRAALLAARERTLLLAAAYEDALGARGMRVPYDAGLNPPLWEWGHVAWFQQWWISRNLQRDQGIRCDPQHERPPSPADALYDSSHVPHATRWQLALPDAQRTREELAHVLDDTLRALSMLPPGANHDELYFFRLVALHEMMHAEAAAYMAVTLGLGVPGQHEPRVGVEGELYLPATSFRLGAIGAGFAFDNELGACDVQVGPLRIDAQPVGWARFLPFVASGGYDEPRWWTPAGREWLATQPAVWRRSGDAWQQRRGARWHEVEPDRVAIHLSAHEADAWCAWAGRRLPTEAEWECAASTLAKFEWGAAWEWTSSAFTAYAGFEPHPYRDYSQPWFGTRRTLRGASAATSPWLANARYRNFFEPHRRDVFAGFRSVARP